MAIVHEATKDVVCKIVYHGAGKSGKTTNLLYMNHHLPASHRGQFISLETPTERTLFFDLLPVVTQAGEYRVRCLLYATPGQEYYHASRRLVLKGADAVVFVVDSQRDRVEENWQALELLEKNLKELGQPLDGLPLVLQYNKRDLPGAMPLADAERRYNPKRRLSFPAIARTGDGVFETFQTIAKLALTKLAVPGGEAQAGPGFKSLIVTEDDAERLGKLLDKVNTESGALGSLLVEESSAILASAGRVVGDDVESLGALLACNFTAAQELSGIFSGAGFAGTTQRGRLTTLRSYRVDARRFLVAVCGPKVGAKAVRDAAIYARGPLAAQLQLMESMTADRLARQSGRLSAVAQLAVAGFEGA